jgi:polysaccharide deacetylase family sporulation protein PdaB
MFIYVMKAKSLYYALAVLLISIVIIVISLLGVKALDVFNPGRQLPIFSVDYPDKKAAITFDCAWGASDIPVILDILKKDNIKATFFLVGQWAEKYPDETKLIANAGHDVANHSYSHLRMSAIDRNKAKSEITRCTDIISGITGAKTNLFRPPYGDFNDSVVTTARDLGYYTIQWDVDSLDWKPGISMNEIISRVLTKVQPGSIILFHNDTANTAKSLPTIIAALKEKGYGFAPVSSLIYKKDYYIDVNGRQKVKAN